MSDTLKVCEKHRVEFFGGKDCDVCNLMNARKSAIDEAIQEVTSGRTINNFGHVPEVRRALEWVWMDLQKLRDK